MIIQHYDFEIRCRGWPVYGGDTYFGFFHPSPGRPGRAPRGCAVPS